jgi:hypothetical protein
MTHADTRFRLSAKRTSSFKLAGASVQSTTGSRGGRISGSNAGYTMFRAGVKVLATHSIRQFPLHFPTLASPSAITFQLDSTCTQHRSRYALNCPGSDHGQGQSVSSPNRPHRFRGPPSSHLFNGYPRCTDICLVPTLRISGAVQSS